MIRRVAAAIPVALLLTSSAALAQTNDATGGADWRRGERPVYQSPQSWAFEVRLGPYKPQIDQEFGTSPGPYERIFGNSNRVFIGAELDYQLLRIPFVGTIGPGVAWQYTKMSGTAKKRGTDTNASETTGLWIMPMYLAAVLRVDVLARELGVPLVPYGKLGVGYALWKASNDLGTSSYDGVAGKGHSYGLHYAGGLALELDPFDRRSAAQLDESVGINHSYLFFELMRSNLDGFGSNNQMRVGASTWSMGMAFEI